MSVIDRIGSWFSKPKDIPNEDTSAYNYLVDFDSFPRNTMYYGGDAGQKYGISAFDANWIIKFPKSTADLTKPQRSYTTSPLSEYIGSHIYSLLGHDVHETKLGMRDGKLVVACRDFLATGERLVEFKNIKNAHITTASDSDQTVTSGGGTDLEEVLYTIDADKTLQAIDGVKARFWDMFVIDAFIGNNDRNNMNWGLIGNSTGSMRLAPIYDNGNAFFNKRSDVVMAARVDDTALLAEDAFGTFRCTYLYPGSEHHINPFEFMADHTAPELTAAIMRFTAALDMSAIRNFINEIPAVDNGTPILGSGQRRFYLALLETRAAKIKDYCTATNRSEACAQTVEPKLDHNKVSDISPAVAKDNAARATDARNSHVSPPNNAHNKNL